MNKSAIALAVAAALAASAAAQAETTLYGSARASVEYNDVDADDTEADLGDGEWDVVNNSSRLGVKGSEDLGNGLSAIYQYEFGVDVTEGGNFNSNRPKYVGLSGGFGTVAIGTQWAPHYNAVGGVTDIFNGSGSAAWLLGTSPFRLTNTLAYMSPDFGGFQVQAALVMDDNAPSGSEGLDAWNIAGIYENGPIFAGASYISYEEGEDDVEDGSELWGVGIGYAGDALGVSLAYEHEEFDAGDAETDGLTGTVSYAFGANIVRAAYGVNDSDLGDLFDDDDIIDDDFETDSDFYALGFQHNLSQRTRLWAEYFGEDNDDFDAATFSLGVRHDF